MRAKGIIAVSLVFLLSGCGISQADYDRVAAERDSLQQQVNAQSESLSSLEDRISSLEETAQRIEEEAAAAAEEAEEEPVEEAPEPEPASVEISSSDIAVVKEFYRQYTGHYLLVQNHASVNARIVSNTMMYDAENNVIGVTGGMADAVAPGATVLIYEPIIDAEDRIDHLETTFDAAEARDVQSVLQDLTAEVVDDGGWPVIVRVTNNGSESARLVQGTCLYIFNEEMAYVEDMVFMNDQGVISPGETIEMETEINGKYDSVEFYLTGGWRDGT